MAKRWFSIPFSSASGNAHPAARPGRVASRGVRALTFLGMVLGLLACAADNQMPAGIGDQALSAAVSQGQIAPAAEVQPPDVTVAGTLEPGQTLSHLVYGVELPDQTARELLGLLTSKIDPHSVRPGNAWTLVTSPEGALKRFRYVLSREKRYEVVPVMGQLQILEEAVDIERRQQLVTGTVKSTLVEAILEQGADYAFAMALVDAFQWDINFYTDVQEGDTFEALVDRVYLDGKADRVDKVLAARYRGKTVGTREAIWFEGDYFSAKGESLQRSFLTTPLSVLRVTSRFGQRFHPVLKVRRLHAGMDYGASTGTPVWSIADGKVLFAGRGGGYGNQVMIAHAGGIVSRYAHLSRVSMKQGQVVRQKQRVGAVGQSGLATGPHLHFEILQGGRQINPARLRMLPTVVKKVKNMETFLIERDRLLQELSAQVAVAQRSEPLPSDASAEPAVLEQTSPPTRVQ